MHEESIVLIFLSSHYKCWVILDCLLSFTLLFLIFQTLCTNRWHCLVWSMLICVSSCCWQSDFLALSRLRSPFLPLCLKLEFLLFWSAYQWKFFIPLRATEGVLVCLLLPLNLSLCLHFAQQALWAPRYFHRVMFRREEFWIYGFCVTMRKQVAEICSLADGNRSLVDI